MPLFVKIITDTVEFRQLKEDWNELAGRVTGEFPGSFSRWEWNFLWWERYSAGLSNACLHIIAFYDSKQLVGLAPMYLRVGPGGIFSLHLLGDVYETTLYADLVVDGPWRGKVLAELVRLVAKGKYWYFHTVNTLPGSLCHEFVKLYTFREWPAGECPFVMLPAAFPEFLKQRRRNMQKDRRRLYEELGARPVDLLPRGREAIEILFELHEESFRQMGKPTGFRKSHRMEFHWALIQALMPSRQVYLQGIELAGRVIGASYGFCDGHRSVGYQLGYDSSFRKYGIGFQLILNETEWAIERGLVQHDLSLGCGAHKDAFTNESRQIFRMTAAFNHPARALLWCGKGLDAGKRLARRFLRPNRRAAATQPITIS